MKSRTSFSALRTARLRIFVVGSSARCDPAAVPNIASQICRRMCGTACFLWLLVQHDADDESRRKFSFVTDSQSWTCKQETM